MVQIRFSANTTALDNLSAFVDQFPQVAGRGFQETADKITPPALDELSFVPGPVKYPIQWASERQRRAYFATNGFGAGIPYQRTGKLAQSWEAFVRQSGDRYDYIIRNPTNAAKYVYGSLAQNRAAALRFQQPFHRNTGWFAATDTVRFWLDAFEEEYRQWIRRIGNVDFSRRAFTG